MRLVDVLPTANAAVLGLERLNGYPFLSLEPASQGFVFDLDSSTKHASS
jgi:hypothetical protein